MKLKNLLVYVLFGLVAFSLQACTVYAPSWFESQYNPQNPLSLVTECGPTTASNVVCLKTGKCLGKEHARKTQPNPLLWRMQDVEAYLRRHGVNYEAVSPDTATKASERKNLTIIVFDGVHFKIVLTADHSLQVYDSLFGVYAADWALLDKAVGPILII